MDRDDKETLQYSTQLNYLRVTTMPDIQVQDEEGCFRISMRQETVGDFLCKERFFVTLVTVC